MLIEDDTMTTEQLQNTPASEIQQFDEIYTLIGDTMGRGRVYKIKEDGPDNVVFFVRKDKNTEGQVKYRKTAMVRCFTQRKMSVIIMDNHDYSYETAVRKFLFTYPDRTFSIREVYLNIKDELGPGLANLDRTQRCLAKMQKNNYIKKHTPCKNNHGITYGAKSVHEVGDVIQHKDDNTHGIITAVHWDQYHEHMTYVVHWYPTNRITTTHRVTHVPDPMLVQDVTDWWQYYRDGKPPADFVYIPLDLRRAVYRTKKDVDATGKKKGQNARTYDNQVLIEIGLLTGILADRRRYQIGKDLNNNSSILIYEPYKSMIIDYLDKYYPSWRAMNRKPRTPYAAKKNVKVC